FTPGSWQMAASEVIAIGAENTRPFLTS
ncbi:hypothetical protein ACQWHD_24475, partial [Salmonella enterica subsp. enterica serovar Infantis]